jgi:hypothetical protein
MARTRRSTLSSHHNYQIGLVGGGDDDLIENDTIAYNNYPTLSSLGFEEGGTKFRGDQSVSGAEQLRSP